MVAPAITLTGPLFRLGSRPIIEAMDKGVIDILARGEELIKEQLYAGHGVITGQYRRGIRGERTRSRQGTIHDSQAVQGSWLEGTSSRNQSTRFKGYAMFRRTTQWLNKQKGRIQDKMLKYIVRKLNGR